MHFEVVNPQDFRLEEELKCFFNMKTYDNNVVDKKCLKSILPLSSSFLSGLFAETSSLFVSMSDEKCLVTVD